MPTYEYKNIETGELYEFRQSMRDDALTHHPETGAAIKRIVSVPGIAFKGSGFYANDSRARTSGPGKPEAAKSDGAKPEGAKSEGAPSDGAKSEGAKSAGAAGSGSAAPARAEASPPATAAKPATGTGGE